MFLIILVTPTFTLSIFLCAFSYAEVSIHSLVPISCANYPCSDNSQTAAREQPDNSQTSARQQPDISQAAARQQPDNSQTAAR